MLPTNFHPDLTEERLSLVAAVLVAVRSQALAEHDPGKGDGPWGLGCRVYERSIAALIAKSHDWHWLRIIDPSACSHFQIGAVPVRIYSGDSHKPTARTLRRHWPELHQSQLLLSAGEHWGTKDTFWRIAIETDFDGDVSNVVLVQLSSEDETRSDVLYSWSIPFSDTVRAITSMAPPAAPVDLGEPQVGDHIDDLDDVAQNDED